MAKIDVLRERLDKLIGVPLLGTTGNLYFLRDYKVERKTVRGFFTGWFSEGRNIDYISEINITSSMDEGMHTNFFTYKDDRAVSAKINELIDGRRYYLNMLRAFNKMGYTIRRKINVPTLS